jgi:uncharacterized membrane protein YoaK (UPF0700 family)
MASHPVRNDVADGRWSWRAPVATRDVLVVLLAFTAGYVDAISYLGLGNVFTSNMTGNTVLLGLALGQARAPAALRATAALAGYLLGVALGALFVKRATRRMLWPATVTAALALECGLLLAFTLWGTIARPSAQSGMLLALIALLAIAMGMQTAAMHAMRVAGVATTAITGTWVSFMSGFIARLRPPHGDLDASTPPPAAAVQAAVIAVYLAAAAAAGLAESRWLLAAAALPTAVVALVVVVALLRFRPERPDQGE